MPLRLIEIIVPESARSEVDAMLAEEDVIDSWQEPVLGERHLVKVLVQATDTEAVVDLMERRFGQLDAFRVVICVTEATLPRAVEATEAAPEQTPEAKRMGRPKRSRVYREELFNSIEPGAHITGVYVVSVVLSTIVAAAGLYEDSVAVIIGAMVIAPLLTPLMALSLATTLGDGKLAWKALRTNLAGVGIALGLSVVAGLLIDDVPLNDSFASRAHPTVWAFAVALASGTAGALAFTTGLPAALVGVMVAVALLPPTVVAGVSMGAGRWSDASGALLLLAINLTCVILAAMATFWVQGVGPSSWWEADDARRETRVALALLFGLLIVLGGLLAVHSIYVIP